MFIYNRNKTVHVYIEIVYWKLIACKGMTKKRRKFLKRMTAAVMARILTASVFVSMLVQVAESETRYMAGK